MKNFIIWVAAIMLISFGIGMTIVGNTGGISLEKTEVSDQKSISLESISQIEIAGISEGVEIVRSDNSNLEVSIRGFIGGKDRNASISLEKIGEDKVKVKINRPKFLFSFIDIEPLKVNLPRNYSKSLKLDTVSGEIKSLDSSNLDKIEARSVSGEIIMGKLNNKVKASSISGSIELNFSSLANSVDVDNTSGRISLELPKDASYSLNFDTVSGHFENDTNNNFNKTGRRNYDGSVNEGKYSINIKTTSGELELTNN